MKEPNAVFLAAAGLGEASPPPRLMAAGARASAGPGMAEQPARSGKFLERRSGESLDLHTAHLAGTPEPGATHTSSKNGPPRSRTASLPSSAFLMAAASKPGPPGNSDASSGTRRAAAALEPDRGAKLLSQRQEIPCAPRRPDVVARDDYGWRLPRSTSAIAVHARRIGARPRR